MSTKIPWTDETWNPVVGCSKTGMSCENCYAEKQARRLAGGLAKGVTWELYRKVIGVDGKWSGDCAEASDWTWAKPLRWKKPRAIFVCSMGDLFHKNVEIDWIRRVLEITQVAELHNYIILTKRPENMCAMLESAPPLPNVWLGVSAGTQAELEERLPQLAKLKYAGWNTVLSLEPLLEPVKFYSGNMLWDREGDEDSPVGGDACVCGRHWVNLFEHAQLCAADVVIVGGESGHGARRMETEWARIVRDVCERVGVDFYFKQWGAVNHGPVDDHGAPLLDGKAYRELAWRK